MKRPMLIFHPFEPNGEIINSNFSVGGDALPECFISECYGYSLTGEWFRLIKRDLMPFTSFKIKNKEIYGWGAFNSENLPNKLYKVKAMLLVDALREASYVTEHKGG